MNDWTKVRYFKPSEFAQRGLPASGLLMDMDFVLMIDELRHRCGFPFIITSGYRTHEHNKLIGGAKNSMHLEGKACDIAVYGERAFILLDKAIRMGFKGVGVKQKGEEAKRFIHLDMRDKAALWSY